MAIFMRIEKIQVFSFLFLDFFFFLIKWRRVVKNNFISGIGWMFTVFFSTCGL